VCGLRCPLYPQERTFSEATSTSVNCHRRTFSPSCPTTVCGALADHLTVWCPCPSGATVHYECHKWIRIFLASLTRHWDVCSRSKHDVDQAPVRHLYSCADSPSLACVSSCLLMQIEEAVRSPRNALSIICNSLEILRRVVDRSTARPFHARPNRAARRPTRTPPQTCGNSHSPV
jgi:hypothetical protein